MSEAKRRKSETCFDAVGRETRVWRESERLARWWDTPECLDYLNRFDLQEF